MGQEEQKDLVRQDGETAPPENAAPEQPAPPKTAKEQLYDKIPITFRQADILVKVLLVLFVVIVIVAILTGGLFR